MINTVGIEPLLSYLRMTLPDMGGGEIHRGITVILHHQIQQYAVEGEAVILRGQQFAQAVNDQAIIVALHGLDHMAMRADHQIRTGIDQAAGQTALLLRNRGGIELTEMHINHHILRSTGKLINRFIKRRHRAVDNTGAVGQNSRVLLHDVIDTQHRNVTVDLQTALCHMGIGKGLEIVHRAIRRNSQIFRAIAFQHTDGAVNAGNTVVEHILIGEAGQRNSRLQNAAQCSRAHVGSLIQITFAGRIVLHVILQHRATDIGNNAVGISPVFGNALEQSGISQFGSLMTDAVIQGNITGNRHAEEDIVRQLFRGGSSFHITCLAKDDQRRQQRSADKQQHKQFCRLSFFDKNGHTTL